MQLTDENFDEQVLKNQKPVVVDFFAEWCAPCQVLGPLLEKLTEEFSGKFILAKANLDETSFLAQKFDIDRIPAVIFFKNGKPVNGFVGLLPEPAVKMEEVIQELHWFTWFCR